MRASVIALDRDLGLPLMMACTLVAVGLVGWALHDLAAAHAGYFRLARFHGSLELCALAPVVLRRRR